MVPPAAVNAAPASQEIELRFRRAVAIAVTVVGKDGQPFEGAVAVMRDAGLSLDSMRTNNSGEASLLAPVGGRDLVIRVMYPDSGRWLTVETKGVRADAGRVEVRLP